MKIKLLTIIEWLSAINKLSFDADEMEFMIFDILDQEDRVVIVQNKH